jgi:hypothetical protein
MEMKHRKKIIIAAILSLLTGVAFATPLFAANIFTAPLPFSSQGPKADFSLDLIYTNFTVEPTSPNTPLPIGYNISRDGDPSIISYNVVLNVTNNSNETALIDMLYFCAGNSSVKGSTIIKNSTTMQIVDGVWLDGQWVNTTWIPTAQIPSNTGVQGYWQQGVYIRNTYTNGILSSTDMRINGTWVDVTGRINVPDQSSEAPLNNVNVMTELIASKTLQFVKPQDSYTGSTPEETHVSVGSSGDFSNYWSAHQSRLIILNGTAIASPATVEYLKSEKTLLRVQASTMLANNYINSTNVDTSLLTDSLNQIRLEPINGNQYVYNMVLGENQVFQTDKFGVEAFIKSVS